MTLSKAAQKLVWLKLFPYNLGDMTNNRAVKIYEDNKLSIALAKTPKFYKRTKHIYI